MSLYLRNIQTGAIKTVDAGSTEFADLKAERTDDDRFPLWEQTGQHDADPREAYEVTGREQWDAPLHDVTTDGAGQSDAAVKKLDNGQDLPSGQGTTSGASSSKK